jgi:hypothetical protein
VRSATLEEQINHAPVTPVPVRNPRPRAFFDLGPLSFIFCLTNAGIFTATIARYLTGQQAYTDLVSGPLAWANVDKGFDFRVFYVFLATFALLLALLALLGRRLQRNSNLRQRSIEPGLALALLPAALWLGGRLATNSFGAVPIESLFSGSAVLIFAFLVSRARLIATDENVNKIISASLLVLLFGFFGGLGLATVLSRIFHLAVTLNTTISLVTAVCGFEFVAVTLVTAFSVTTEEIEERLGRIVFGAQLLLPMLWAVVLPPAIVESGHRIESHPSVALPTALCLAATVSWVVLIHRWIAQKAPASGDSRLPLVPLAIVPIAIFVATNHPLYPTFFGDDFHTGEHLLPWQQLHDFGKLPFVDFVPVHALMDFFVSWVNAVFFDGTLANYGDSRTILFAVAGAVTFLTVARFAGVGLALCLAMAANLWDRLLFVPAVLVILCDARLMAKSQRWLLCWFFICPLAVSYNPAAGIALTLASLPIALIQLWQLINKDRNALWRIMLVLGSIMISLALIPTFRVMAFGFAHFLTDNARAVTLVHGIGWQADKAGMPSVRGVLAAPLVWEMFRFSWIVALLVGGWIFVSQAGEWRNASRQGLAMGAMGCLFLFFLSGWTINRIDASLPSRTGEVSYLACLYLLPLMLYGAGRWRRGSILVFLLVIGFFQGAMADFNNSGSKPHSGISMNALIEKPSTALEVPSGCISIDGPSLKLPNLGHIYAPREVLESVLGLRAALTELLRPGETYLDLTGRQANYFYLGMPVPVSYGASWLTANMVLQENLLSQIKSQRPRVVWLGPGPFRDADGPAFRTYQIYRFLIQHYVPLVRSGKVFLVTPDLTDPSLSSPAEQLELLREVFEPASMERLPSAWGSSWSRLQKRFVVGQQLSGKDTGILNRSSMPLVLTNQTISGAKNDFLRIDFFSNLSPKARMEIEVRWISENGPSSARFVAGNGTNLIPLGVSPDWLLSKSISEVTIVPVSPPADLKYALRNGQFFQLED